jgi:hypothetical protein
MKVHYLTPQQTKQQRKRSRQQKRKQQSHRTCAKESEQPGQAGPTTIREAASQALLRIWGYRAGQKNPGRVEQKFFLEELFKKL